MPKRTSNKVKSKPAPKINFLDHDGVIRQRDIWQVQVPEIFEAAQFLEDQGRAEMAEKVYALNGLCWSLLGLLKRDGK